jgi:hypothetical protein
LGLVRCVLCDGWKTSCSCSLTVDRHSLILFIAGGSSNRIANTERVMACWLMISGAIHMIIEGAFSFALGWWALSDGSWWFFKTYLCLICAGYVVLTPDYFQHTADNYLSEACEWELIRDLYFSLYLLDCLSLTSYVLYIQGKNIQRRTRAMRRGILLWLAWKPWLLF